MGVLIPVGYGLAVARLRCAGASRDAVVTFGFNPTTLDPVNDSATIYAALTNNSGDGGVFSGDTMSSSWTFKGVSVTEMDDTGPLIGETLVPIVGEATLAVPPSNCTMLINKNTSAGGRKGRGRMYAPITGLGESNIDPMGIIDSGQIPSQQARWDDVWDYMDTNDVPMVLLHSAAGAPNVITSLTVQGSIATQRRRIR